jgi:hypothetical protein
MERPDVSRSSNFVRFLRGCRRALWGLPHPPPPYQCRHEEWEFFREILVHDAATEEMTGSNLPVEVEFILQCTQCGDLKKADV